MSLLLYMKLILRLRSSFVSAQDEEDRFAYPSSEAQDEGGLYIKGGSKRLICHQAFLCVVFGVFLFGKLSAANRP